VVWFSQEVEAMNGKPAARLGDGVSKGVIVQGSRTVLIGSQGRTITFEALEPGQSLYSPSEDIWLLRGGLQAGSLVQELPGLGTTHLLEQLQHNPATPTQKQPIQEQHMPQWLQGRFAWVHPELARKRHLILAASGQGDTDLAPVSCSS